MALTWLSCGQKSYTQIWHAPPIYPILILNVFSEGRSRVRWLMYHLFTLLQNVGMLAFWYLKHYRDPLEPDWYAFMLITMVIGGTLIGSLLTLLYYK